MDFILKWQDKLKETMTSPLTIKIFNELETLKVFYQIINFTFEWNVCCKNMLILGLFTLH